MDAHGTSTDKLRKREIKVTAYPRVPHFPGRAAPPRGPSRLLSSAYRVDATYASIRVRSTSAASRCGVEAPESAVSTAHSTRR